MLSGDGWRRGHSASHLGQTAARPPPMPLPRGETGVKPTIIIIIIIIKYVTYYMTHNT